MLRPKPTPSGFAIARRRIVRAGAFLMLAAAGLIAGGTAMGQSAPADGALIVAAGRGDAAEVQRLLAAGASVKERDGAGRTALLAATQGNHVAAARLNAKDAIADSPYLLAGASGHLEILKLTLEAGADLASVNRYGGTALIPAAHHGHVETVRTLLATGIAVDHVNRLGWTALLEAVILGDGGPRHAEIVRLLIAASADVNLADRNGVTPLAHARNRGQSAVARLLEQAGAR